MALLLLACGAWSTTATWAVLDYPGSSGGSSSSGQALGTSLEFVSDGHAISRGNVVERRNASFGFYAVTMPKRKKHMRRFMEDTQLPIKLVKGVPHHTLNGTELQETRQILSRYCQPLKAVALTIAHRKALKLFLLSEHTYGVIFEDDVALSESQSKEKAYGDRDLSEVFMELGATSNEFSWDMLNLGRCVDYCDSDETVAGLNGAKTAKLVKSGNPLCAHAYMVTRKGAERLLRNTWPFFAIWDMMPILMNKLAYDNQFRLMSVTPRLFKQDRVEIKDSLHKDTNPECAKSDGSHYVRLYELLSEENNMLWKGEKFTYERETMTCKY
uniref:Glycosyl transferase family 25 domain-containing protein n=1 Tax=Lotharella globosa TaxID=91324 RepID=A0A7S4DX07_9EUKA|mmetsp:Transcript_26229/g.51328  ORF Transcript_26229/g.51328 Transcript_26229/m.51328 type:complete len:328 (+) Transcript_26229:60-1043(+)